MAIKAKRPCNYPGCINLVTDTPYCHEHSKPTQYNKDNRETATKRGYNTRWNKARKIFLDNNPLCKHCFEQGIVEPATDVDHIRPCTGDDPEFWNQNNWQGLCHSCHSIKTAKHDGAFGRQKENRVNANRQPCVNGEG